MMAASSKVSLILKNDSVIFSTKYECQLNFDGGLFEISTHNKLDHTLNYAYWMNDWMKSTNLANSCSNTNFFMIYVYLQLMAVYRLLSMVNLSQTQGKWAGIYSRMAQRMILILAFLQWVLGSSYHTISVSHS